MIILSVHVLECIWCLWHFSFSGYLFSFLAITDLSLLLYWCSGPAVVLPIKNHVDMYTSALADVSRLSSGRQNISKRTSVIVFYASATIRCWWHCDLGLALCTCVPAIWEHTWSDTVGVRACLQMLLLHSRSSRLDIWRQYCFVAATTPSDSNWFG